MYVRRAITRFQLSRLSQRIINVINAEAIFTGTQIATWRSMSTSDPVRALEDIAKAITALRIETLKDYDFDLKMANNNKKKEVENG